jgi:ankyrin repeat protein
MLLDEVRLYICSFLEAEDLVKTSLVSKCWRESVEDEQLWRKLNLRFFGTTKLPETQTWKQFTISNFVKLKSLGADKDEILLWATEYGHNRILYKALSANKDISVRKMNKLLLKSSYKGHKDVVECLLSFNANIEACTKSGFTALHMASGKGHADVVETLLKHNAHVEASNKNGTTKHPTPRPTHALATHKHMRTNTHHTHAHLHNCL